jgi:hypothetical protein
MTWVKLGGQRNTRRDSKPSSSGYFSQGALGADPVVLVQQTNAFTDMAGVPYETNYEFRTLVGVTVLRGKSSDANWVHSVSS